MAEMNLAAMAYELLRAQAHDKKVSVITDHLMQGRVTRNTSDEIVVKNGDGRSNLRFYLDIGESFDLNDVTRLVTS